MAESQSATAQQNHDSQTKQVQELAADLNHLPERYLRKEDEEYGSVKNAGASSPMSEEAINHGIEGSFLEKIREITKLFFGLPIVEKKNYSRVGDDLEGYGNDVVVSEKQTLDWNDRLYLFVLPKHKRRLQFWPQNPTHFREVCNEYVSKIELMNEFLLKALARSLNLEENCFLDQYGTRASMEARFNYYPPCPCPDKVLGVKPHADISALTFLLQNKEVEGLQVLKDGQWVGVPIVQDALTINVGDQLEIMSNGVFKSPVHRVLINSSDARMSVALFCMPQTEKDIGPVDGLVTDETPRLYKDVTFNVDSFFKYYQKGMRAIDACKI